MARRGDEVQTEALEVVVRAGEATDLQLAAVARAGVDLADGERATEARADLVGETGAQALDLRLAGRRLGDDAGAQGDTELAQHAVSAAASRAARAAARAASSACPRGGG